MKDFLIGFTSSCTGMWLATLIGLQDWSLGWIVFWLLATILFVVGFNVTRDK